MEFLSADESWQRIVNCHWQIKYAKRKDEVMKYNYNEKKRFVRYKNGAKLYDVCQSTFEKWAKEAGAVCKVGKAVIVDCEVLDRYLETFRIPAE